KRGRNQRKRARELDVVLHVSMRQAASAMTAATEVVTKLSRSLLTSPRGSRVEPSTLSIIAAATAATPTGTIIAPGMRCRLAAIAASSSAAAAPAAVPSEDTAPDVPGGTGFIVVTSHVRRP